MEFIQCPHCKKQYAASNKLQAAVGKKIRCKHCNQPFEIRVQTRSTETETNVASTETSKPELAQTDEIGETEETAKDVIKPVAKTKPAKKTLNIQLLFTIVLATTLLLTLVAAFLFQPDLFSTTSRQEAKNIETEGIFKPINVKIIDPKLEPIAKDKVKEPVHVAAPEAADNIIHPRSKTPVKELMTTKKQKPVKTFNPSQVCKDVSAEYWVRSNRLATASLDTKTYMKLLDQNLVQADEIRRACKDKTLVGIISKAARTENRLDWFKHEINIVLDKANADNRNQL